MIRYNWFNLKTQRQMKNQTITSATNGQHVPGISSNILIRMGKPVINGNGQPITDDRWIYVSDRNGRYSINVPRSEYCRKLSMMQISILESIGNKKVTKRLQNFIDKIASTLVFEKYGHTYQVSLKKVGYKYDLDRVFPYWNESAISRQKKYCGLHNYQISVHIKSTFFVDIEK
jgi:hypothetical protein